ncbi:MAG: GNAT family N-acetyltransferase, partial [Patescibacteria group bacterium]
MILKIRLAELTDARLLLDWRNDPETRGQSVNTDEVAWADHWAWLERALENPYRSLWIAEQDLVPVGTVRFDFDPAEDPERWELSWTVAPEVRGRGVGALIVETAVQA